MARARQRGATGAGGSTQTGRVSGSATDSGARSASRKPRAAEVEVIEEKAGFGMEEGIVFVTTLVLIVAFLMLDKVRGGYAEGMFFN